MDIVESRIGAHRMDKVYAWKTMLDMGIHASGGSDAPVVDFNVRKIYILLLLGKISRDSLREDGYRQRR